MAADARRDPVSAPNRPAAPTPVRRPPNDDRPVEFWPTAAIRAALETDDLTVWQRIVVAIKRDPYGRTARQVEEVLETVRPYGVSKALAEVLTRTREHLEANERAEVARHIQVLMERSGLGPAEFASRIGVPTEEFATYLSAAPESVGVIDDPDAPAVGSVRQDAGPAHGQSGLISRPMPTTYALIPGAGGEAWYWHRVAPLLTDRGAEVVVVGLPFDDSADLTRHAEIVSDELAGVTGPVILVGQSMGAFIAPMVAERRPAALIVLVNPLVPTPGESVGQWWVATGQKAAMVEHFDRIGVGPQRVRHVRGFLPRRARAGPSGGAEQATTRDVRHPVRAAVAVAALA